ncbi:MAG: NAD-dependent epimerase [Bacteroidia bacterium]|nr:NAD-dependent epimerase [Bacteroidia bacterium]
MKRILVTGAAGFIGSHLVKKLIDRGDVVLGLDSINDYYDVNLKYSRLSEAGIEKNNIIENEIIQSTVYSNYSFIKSKLEDLTTIKNVFKIFKPDAICNLAAQAGVRYSLENPHAYINSNIIGFINLLEAAREFPVSHFVYASSSSVYGLNTKMPLSVSDNVDHPISLYAASKKSNELMAHTYSHLFNVPTTGLRFFTVYGPKGRPDMALFLFTKAIIEGKPIDVFNNGNMVRDFTYIDDIVEGITRVIDNPPTGQKEWNSEHPDPATSPAPYRLFNIGNSSPIKLMEYIGAIEEALGKKAIKNFLPLQLGDVPKTHADVTHLENAVGYKPATPVKEGIKRFVEWYKEYYK